MAYQILFCPQAYIFVYSLIFFMLSQGFFTTCETAMHENILAETWPQCYLKSSIFNNALAIGSKIQTLLKNISTFLTDWNFRIFFLFATLLIMNTSMCCFLIQARVYDTSIGYFSNVDCSYLLFLFVLIMTLI